MRNHLVLQWPLPEGVHIPITAQQVLDLSDNLPQLSGWFFEVRFLLRQAWQSAGLPSLQRRPVLRVLPESGS